MRIYLVSDNQVIEKDNAKLVGWVAPILLILHCLFPLGAGLFVSLKFRTQVISHPTDVLFRTLVQVDGSARI